MLKSIQAFDQTEKLLLFDRISVAVIADDNIDGRDKQTITQMAGINNTVGSVRTPQGTRRGWNLN